MPIDAGELRALLRDPDEVVFDDDDIEAAINAAGSSILRAAGIAFQSLAAEYAQKSKSVRTDDLAIDVKSRGSDLLAVARSFFDEANASDTRAASGFLGVVEFSGRPGDNYCARPEGTPRPVIC